MEPLPSDVSRVSKELNLKQQEFLTNAKKRPKPRIPPTVGKSDTFETSE